MADMTTTDLQDSYEAQRAQQALALAQTQTQAPPAPPAPPPPPAPPAQAIPTQAAPAPSPPPRSGASSQSASFGREPVPGVQPISFAELTGAPGAGVGASSTTEGKDTGLRAFGDMMWASTLQMAQGIVGAASFAARQGQEDPFAGTPLADPNFKSNPELIEHLEQAKRSLGEHIAATIQDMAPAQQRTLAASMWGGTDENGAPVPTVGDVGFFHYIGANIAAAVPTAVLALVPGGLIVRALSAAGFGAMQAGDAYNSLVDQVDAAKPAELMRNPAYAEMIKQGVSDVDARKMIVGQLAKAFVPLQFAVGAAAGVGLGALGRGGSLVAGGSSLVRRMLFGAGEGAATMGGQAGAQNALEQAASVRAGTQGEFSPAKTAMALVSGALGGAVFGAGGGALHGAPAPAAPTERAPAKQTGEDVYAALQTELPLGDAPPGFVQGGSQGELFRTIDQAQAEAQARAKNPPPPPAPAPPPPVPTQAELPLGQAPPGFTPASPQGELFRTVGQANAPPAAPVPTAPKPVPPVPTQANIPLTQAPPGFVPASPQGELFRTIDQANAQAPATTPTAAAAAQPPAPGKAAPAQAAPAKPAPAKPAPAKPAFVPKITPVGPGDTAVVTQTAPEPRAHVIAQIRALADPAHPKDAVFISNATRAQFAANEMPWAKDKLPDDVIVVRRQGGMLLTTDDDKATLFRRGPITDEKMAKILGLQESKAQAIAATPAGGSPTVVQAVDAQGNVIHEAVASPSKTPEAMQAAVKQAPNVRVVSPADALNARSQANIAEAKERMAGATPAKPAPPARVEPTTTTVALSRLPPARSAFEADARDAIPPDAMFTPTQPPPSTSHPVDEAAAAAAPEPSPAQTAAGNYAKGHVRLHGLDVSIETPKGGVRRGPVDEKTGKPAWETTMPSHYGYLRGTKGADGDHVDVALGPNVKAMFDGSPADAANHPVFVVDQIDPKTGKFDEHKALVGFASRDEAIANYDASFSDHSGPSRRGAVSEMPFEKFKEWLKGDTTKPIAYKQGDFLKQRAAQKREAQKAKLAPIVAKTKPEVKTESAPEIEAKPAEVKPEAAPKTPEELRADSEAAWVSRTAKERNDYVARRKAAVAEMKARGMSDNDIIAEVSKVNTAMRSTRPELFMNDKQLKLVARHLGDPETSHPEDITAALEASRNLEERSFRPYTGASETARVSPEVEDRLAESDGRVSATDMGDAIRTERQIERQIEPNTEAGAEPNTEAGAEASSGTGMVQDYGEGGPEKERSAATTDVVRKLQDLERKITEGKMTATEADEAYGKPNPKAKPRRFPTLADWLRSRLAVASDPATWEKLSKTKKITAETKAIVELLDPEYLAKLRSALEELKEPEVIAKPQTAAERAVTISKIRSKTKAGTGASPTVVPRPMPAFGKKTEPSQGDRPYAAVLRDRAVNQSLRDMLTGEPRSVHDYLRAIANDPTLKKEAPLAAATAQRLTSLVDKRVTVRASDDPDISGVFHPDQETAGLGHIEISPDGNTQVEAVLHETIHAVLTHYVESLDEDHPDMQALRAIGDELARARTESAAGAPLTTLHRVSYALSDPHELVTMLMTSPEVAKFAASFTPSAAFKQRMGALGYPFQAARSAWAAFTMFVRRAFGLRGPMREPDASFLDHVLRPLEDVLDRASKWNAGEDVEASLPRSPTDIERTGGAVSDAITHALPVFNARAADKLRDAVGSLDFPGMGDKLRRGLLTGATLDAIVDWNRPLFESRDPANPGNSLEAYRTHSEAVRAEEKAFRDEHAPVVKELLKQYDALGSEGETVARLLHDATIADVKIGGKNPHLTTPDELRVSKTIHDRYNNLSDAGRSTYDAIVKHGAEIYKIERDAQLHSIIRTFLPDATTAQADALTTSLRTKAGIDALLKDPAKSPVAAAFAGEWDKNSALVRSIAKVHDLGFVHGDYFPLRRYGDYVVRYGDKGTADYGVEMFERRSQAEARRAELVKAGATAPQVMDKRTTKLRQMFPSALVDSFEQALEKNPALAAHADEARQVLQSVLLQSASHSEAARTRMRRQGVQGASLDVPRVLASDFLATASRMGFLKHGPAQMRALGDMRRHVDWLAENAPAGHNIAASAVVRELEQRMPSVDDSSSFMTGLARRFSSMGFVYSLMSFSHMLTSTVEAHTNSTALLGARHGIGRASLALGKALIDVTPTTGTLGVAKTVKALGKGLQAADWNLSTVVRDALISRGADRANMIDLFNRLNNAGLIDHSMIREMQQIAKPTTDITQGWWHRFLDFSAAGAHAVDATNRISIAKAAYDLELQKTGSHEQAVKYAEDIARKAIPNYSAANRSRIASATGPLGALAGPLTQFKRYGFHMYGLMANLVKASMDGATPAARNEARKAFVGILATHAMMAGTLTLIADPLRWIGGIYDYLFTDRTAPHDYEADVRGFIDDIAGPELGEVFSRGLPHLAGIDLHRRVGLANLLELPELKDFSAKGVGEAVAAAMTGAAGEDAANIAGGVTKLLHGDIDGGLKDVSPRLIRDVVKAHDLATKGVTDSKGRTIMSPDKLSDYDVGVQALGFQPAAVSEFREGRAAVLGAKQELGTARNKAIADYVAASPDDRSDAMDAVRAFNRENPGDRITRAQLLQAEQRQRRAAIEARRSPSAFGVTMLKNRAAAAQLEQAGSFANAQ